MSVMIQVLICLQLVSTAWAQSSSIHDPMSYPLRQYGFVLGTAIFGGLVSWYAKVRKGDVSVWSISQLIGELATSAFAGLLCFWVLDASGVSISWSVPLVGIAGHMGTRGIQALEEWAQKKFPLLGGKDDPHA